MSAHGLRANTDDLLDWLLGALSGHLRVTGRLAVHNLLSRSFDLSSELTLLINDLLTLFQGVVEDNFSLKWNRLLGLGHQFRWLHTRTVLNNASNRFLGGLLLGYLSLVALGGEVSSKSLLTVFAFLDNPDFTRCQVRVLANLGRVRNRNRPSYSLGAFAFSNLGSDDDDLINRRLGLLPLAVLGHLFLARNALGFNLVLAGRNGVVVLVLDLERDLTRRNVDNVNHSVSGIRRAVLVGHGDRNLDLVTRLRIRRGGCGDLAIVVNTDSPTSRNFAQLVWVVLGDVYVIRLVEV